MAFSVTADSVRKNSIGSRILQQHVGDILSSIQASIRRAADDGATSLKIPVPVNFCIADMDNRLAQICVYSEVITKIKKNGFDVKITIGEKQVIFNISWASGDDRNIDEMKSIIAEHLAVQPPKKIKSRKRRES
jgi:hypothetical protein